MNSKKVVEETSFRSWDDVDTALWEISTCINAIAEINTAYNAKRADAEEIIKKLNEQEESDTSSLNADIIALGAQIKAFAKAHRSDFGKKKSKRLNWGIVKFKKSPPKLELAEKSTWERVIKGLEELGLLQYIRTEPEVKKDELKKAELSEYQKTRLGIVITQSEEFYYELNKQK